VMLPSSFGFGRCALLENTGVDIKWQGFSMNIFCRSGLRPHFSLASGHYLIIINIFLPKKFLLVGVATPRCSVSVKKVFLQSPYVSVCANSSQIESRTPSLEPSSKPLHVIAGILLQHTSSTARRDVALGWHSPHTPAPGQLQAHPRTHRHPLIGQATGWLGGIPTGICARLYGRPRVAVCLWYCEGVVDRCA
jgi:hypothetical protein